MPKTNEIAFNVPLLNALRSKHPQWRDRAGVEQQDVLRESALRPDIVIRPPGGIPVVLETEFEPAHTVEADAQARLGRFLSQTGDRIEQTIAVQIPLELKEAPQADLERHIEAAEFRYCTYSLQEAGAAVRWPATGWLAGSVNDLAGCIENVSLSERLLTEGTNILEQSIGEAAGKLRETAGARTRWKKWRGPFTRKTASKPRAWPWPSSPTHSFFIPLSLRRTASPLSMNYAVPGPTM